MKGYFIIVASFLCVFTNVRSQIFSNIHGWPANTNQRIESFLHATAIIKERKVAVFDCDGTLFGQVPHYLADEALYSFAKTKYAGRKDSVSLAKMAIVKDLLEGDNVGEAYVKLRIAFFSGLSPRELEEIGRRCFLEKFQGKFYPEMRELLHNLEMFGFEIWVLTASPELLYQEIVHKNLGIPKNRILGVKSVITNGVVTDRIIAPVPQDEGKADALETFIKARPLLVAGNSRGDLEMMNRSVGLKIIVNPDDVKLQHGIHSGAMDGLTVKDYWERNGAISVYCEDVRQGDTDYISHTWGIPPNRSNPQK
ncbi:MAG: haloacid dehalogenase-like hydrolase [Sediminicola sp.]